jgi:hypothetical protein
MYYRLLDEELSEQWGVEVYLAADRNEGPTDDLDRALVTQEPEWWVVNLGFTAIPLPPDQQMARSGQERLL